MKRMALVVLVVVAILGSAWLALARDWYAIGAAVPPLAADSLSDIDCRLTSVQFGEQAALDGNAEFTWSQYVPVSIVAEMDTSHWFWRLRGKSWDQKAAHMKQFGHLPRASFRISVVRRSSFSPGEAEVSHTGCSAQRLDEHHAQAEGRIWIPQVPGTYRVRVFLRTSTRDERDMPDVQEDLVAVFPLHVLQGAVSQ
jgi:hypothetical protein